ncbi:DNA primase [Methyloceanibacter sp.]|uniref:DNA primase n=1 Tax=Methyloceanibacter sp. TaxID=1965321 RepID=UPI003D6D8578
MKFSDSFLDEIRARLPVSQVVSRRVPLKRAGREWKGLSPFNREKTPSFTVNDQKGFYHCFSSGKHGDIFTFLMETEGLSFPEAVERLAGDAGLPMPKPDPQFERANKERLGLLDALEAAAGLFEEALGAREGRDALLYAERRGLKPETLKEFRIGFAPHAKEALKATLTKRGFTEAQLLEAGLLVKPDDGRPSYDRFRNRLTIPILDVKSRVIGFGARALDPNAEPKYLNSPETRLFDKGSTIFNFARARQAAFDKGELVVVEGYMDVLALHQAGFTNAVATLGTAFTERQMEQLWLLAPEPIICFDGDRAGEAAAARAIDRMLPMLKEGHSFRFAFLPEGMDPDDLVRSQGAPAFTQCLRNARPLIDVLWLRERAEQPIDTPERRAAFEARLDALLAGIANARVRDHYRREVRNRLFALWRERPSPRQSSSRAPVRVPPNSGTMPPPSPRGFATTIALTLVNHPSLLDRFADEVASLEVRDKPLAALLSFVTRIIFERDGISREQLLEVLEASPHAKLLARLSRESAFKRIAFLQPETPLEDVEVQFADLIFRFRALPALSKELDEGADHLADLSEAEFERFATLQQQVASVGNQHAGDDAGDRDAGERFKEKVAQVLREKGTWRRGQRPERRD